MTDQEVDMQKKIAQCWPGDHFNRSADAQFIRAFLVGRLNEREAEGKTRSYVLNIDGGWGRGKSYFLDGLGRYLRLEGHPVAQINAWRDDFASDPLLGIMAAIEDATLELLPKRKVEKQLSEVKIQGGRLLAALGKGAVNGVLRRYVGHSVEQLFELAIGEKGEGDEAAGAVAEETIDKVLAELDAVAAKQAQLEMAQFRQARDAIADFATSLSKLATDAEKEGKAMPFFILIDELDRCRPSYAIQFLERVKHLFEVDNVVFILATNTSEMANSVSAVYGQNFDGVRYLYRFSDRTYQLPTPTIAAFVVARLAGFHGDISKIPRGQERYFIAPDVSVEKYAAHLFELFDLDLRGIGQCLDLLRSVVTISTSRFPVMVSVMLPMIVGRYLGLTPQFSRSFVEQLAEKATKTSTSPITYYDRDAQGGQSLSAMDLLEKIEHISHSTIRPMDQSYSNTLDEWLADVVPRLARNEVGGARRIFSQYPKMIETTGRLSNLDPS